ncbi:MAG: hypothetical protein ABI779_07800 [Acidobacteriota bacterium]
MLGQNLIQNGGFNSSLAGWQQEGADITATWDSGDAGGSPTSGSAKLVTSASKPAGVLRQSFPVTSGYSYEFKASRRGTPFAGSIEFGFQPPYRVTYAVPHGSWGSDADVLHAVPGVTTGTVLLGLKYADGTATAFFDDVSVVELPTAIRSFTPWSSSIAQGQCTRISFEASSATSLSIDQGVGAFPESFNAQWLTPNLCPQTTTTYTLTVSGPTGSTTRQATITVVPPPTATFTATPTSISDGEVASLSWTTTNATTVSIDNGVGSVSASGTASVSPSATTTYMLTANGIGGSTTKQVSVTVTPPKPQISFTASPRTIAEGESSTVSWNVLNATGVSIDHGIGTRPASGSVSVSPTATTTYRLTATGPGGSSTAQVTITVLQAPVIIFTATPSTITRGSATTLTWIVTEATSVVIDNGVGPQPPNGALDIRPTDTTTYLLTATGPGGVRQAQVTITVQVSGRRRAVRH